MNMSATHREERFSRYWQRMVDRTLRREQLVLFISQDIETPASLVQSKVGLLDYYYKTLQPASFRLRRDSAPRSRPSLAQARPFAR